MESNGRKAERLYLRDQRRRAVGEIELVGDRGRRQKGQRVAGQELKFDVRRAAARDRRIHGSPDGVLLHTVQERGRVFGQLQVCIVGEVGERLVHNSKDVHGLLSGRRFRFGYRGDDLLHRFGRIALRLGDNAVAQGGGEVQHKAVRLRFPLLGVDAEESQHRRSEKKQAVGRGNRRTGPKDAAARPAGVPLRHETVEQQQIGEREQCRAHDGFIRGVVEAVGDVERGAPCDKVDREDDAPAEGEDIVVCKAGRKAEQHAERRRAADAPGQQGQKREKQVVPDEVEDALYNGQRFKRVGVVQKLNHEQRPRRPKRPAKARRPDFRPAGKAAREQERQPKAAREQKGQVRIFRKCRLQQRPRAEKHKAGTQEAKLAAKMPRRGKGNIHSQAPMGWNCREAGIHIINVRLFAAQCKRNFENR